MAATIVAAQGIRDLRAHGLSRPAVAEVEAIVRACLLAAEAGAGICIAHVSTAGGAAAVRRAKAEGADVRGETCPHYLLLTEDEAMGLGAIAKVNPPLRGEADRAALWAAVADGTIDQVGSDHAPHTREEKAAGTEDVRRAPSGFAGVQNTLPLLCGEPRLPLRRLVELLCEGPARNWGLWPRKGRVARGADADLAVVRMGVREGAGHGAAGGAGQARGAGDPGGAPAAGDRGAAGPGAGAAPAGGPRPAGGAGAGAGSVWPRQWGLHPDGPLVRLCAPRAEVVATVVGGRVAFAGGSVVGEPRGEWVRG